MEFQKACKKAYKLLKKDGFIGFYLVIDIGRKWVFFGGNPDEPYYGVRTVSVEKETEKCEWFMAQDARNNDMLEKGEKVDFPNSYKYKNDKVRT